MSALQIVQVLTQHTAVCRKGRGLVFSTFDTGPCEYVNIEHIDQNNAVGIGVMI